MRASAASSSRCRGYSDGPHWLNVKFENSLVRVPFRILTKEEEQTLSKNYKDISKQVEEAFKRRTEAQRLMVGRPPVPETTRAGRGRLRASRRQAATSTVA